MRRGKRRNRSTWFPILPTAYGEQGFPGVTWYEQSITIAGPVSAGDTSVVAIPLTFDQTVSPDEIDPEQGYSLADFVQGQDFLLQRVVGKVWFSFDNMADDTAFLGGIACIGLAVLPSGTSTSPELSAEEYNPLFAKNAQQPWIWRRTWRLDNPFKWGPGTQTPKAGFPTNTSGVAGGNIDAGHIDSKMNRRITREHRVYIVAAMGCIDEGTGVEAAFGSFGYDVRVLGQMRRGRNQSSF